MLDAYILLIDSLNITFTNVMDNLIGGSSPEIS